MAPIATLTVRISAQIAELQKSFADASKATQKFQDNFAGMATAAATVGTFLGNVFTKIASSIVSTLGGAIADSIKYANQFQNAFLGLSGVASAFGVSATAATTAAKGLAADGMMPLSDAATGLKNLLSSGFNLEQSTRLMEAFKDSAAFGRSGALSFGDAVRSATEGVKNQNSVLVDNAGVTKNLSVILKESGFQLQDLSDKTKGASARQALYNGILRETAAQQGDAAKASQTYTGAMAALESSYQSLLATWGRAITENKGVQIALTAVGDAFRSMTTTAGDNKTALNFVSDAVAFMIRAFANLLAIFDKIQTGFAEMDKVLSGFVQNIVKGLQLMVGNILDFLKLIDKAPNLARALGLSEGYAQEIGVVQTVYDKLKTTQEAMGAEMKVTQERSAAMSRTLQGIITTARGVADAVEAARGQTVLLGESTKPANVDKGGLASLSKDAVKAQKQFKALVADIREFESGSGIKDFSSMFDWNKAVQNAKLMVVGINQELANIPGFEKDIPVLDFSSMFDFNQAKQNAKILQTQITEEIKAARTPVQDAFSDIFADIPNILRGVLSGGGGIGDVLVGVAGVAANRFSDAFSKRLAESMKGGPKLTGGEKAMGLAGMGLDSFMGGYSMGASGGKTKGALGGAASGALQGAMMGSVVPGIGTAIGAVIGGAAGLFGGLFGGGKKAKEDRAALEANKKALAEQYGGLEKLRTIAAGLGVDISKAFNAKNATQFTAAVEELNKALEDQKKRIEGLNTALKGVNDRAGIFADKFSKLYEAANKPPAGDKLTDKEAQARKNATAALQAQAQSSEAEFARLGLMIRDTFAGLVKETGSGIAALQQMGPAFQMLEDGVSKWGITSTAVIDELRSNFNLVNNEAFKPLFESIASSGEVLRGLFDAKALSPEGFQAIAADIGASIQGIIDKGGDAAKTLALSQPVLQTLWEAQQQYGAVTDETTQAILNQAEEQGLVGAHMKGVNEQILDVLLAIGNVLGADLPEYFNKLKQPAADAAASIENSFTNIEIPTIAVPFEYQAQNKLPEGVSIPAMAAGGIVRRPTLALIGEAGPEAVIPLSSQTSLGVDSANYQTDIYLDGERIARSTAKKLPKIMRGLGVGH